NLYQFITGNDLNPGDFEIVDVKDNFLDSGEAVRRKNTDFYFAIYDYASDYNFDTFLVKFSPGAEKFSESRTCRDWLAVLGLFEKYLKDLRFETSIVDPWANAKDYADKLVETIPKTDSQNVALTGEEKENIQRTLEDIKRLLVGHIKDDKKKQQFL